MKLFILAPTILLVACDTSVEITVDMADDDVIPALQVANSRSCAGEKTT